MIQKLQDSRAVLLGAVAIFAVGLTTSGYVLGDGLRRAKMAERTVTVRGVSERNVTADLATWTIDFSHQGSDLAPVQQSVDSQARSVRAFFQRTGFRPQDITDSDVSVSRERPQRDEPGPERLTVRRSTGLRAFERIAAFAESGVTHLNVHPATEDPAAARTVAATSGLITCRTGCGLCFSSRSMRVSFGRRINNGHGSRRGRFGTTAFFGAFLHRLNQLREPRNLLFARFARYRPGIFETDVSRTTIERAVRLACRFRRSRRGH